MSASFRKLRSILVTTLVLLGLGLAPRESHADFVLVAQYPDPFYPGGSSGLSNTSPLPMPIGFRMDLIACNAMDGSCPPSYANGLPSQTWPPAPDKGLSGAGLFYSSVGLILPTDSPQHYEGSAATEAHFAHVAAAISGGVYSLLLWMETVYPDGNVYVDFGFFLPGHSSLGATVESIQLTFPAFTIGACESPGSTSGQWCVKFLGQAIVQAFGEGDLFTPTNPFPIPEPATLALLALGLAGLGFSRRKQ